MKIIPRHVLIIAFLVRNLPSNKNTIPSSMSVMTQRYQHRATYLVKEGHLTSNKNYPLLIKWMNPHSLTAIETFLISAKPRILKHHFLRQICFLLTLVKAQVISALNLTKSILYPRMPG